MGTPGKLPDWAVDVLWALGTLGAGHSRITSGLGTPEVLRGWVSEFGTRDSHRCAGRPGRDWARSGG